MDFAIHKLSRFDSVNVYFKRERKMRWQRKDSGGHLRGACKLDLNSLKNSNFESWNQWTFWTTKKGIPNDFICIFQPVDFILSRAQVDQFVESVNFSIHVSFSDKLIAIFNGSDFVNNSFFFWRKRWKYFFLFVQGKCI